MILLFFIFASLSVTFVYISNFDLFVHSRHKNSIIHSISLIPQFSGQSKWIEKLFNSV